MKVLFLQKIGLYYFFLVDLVKYIQFSSVQSLSCVPLFATPWTAAHQASLSITNSQSLPKLIFIESVTPSNHLILFSSRLQSFPASGSFPLSQIFTSDGQSIGAHQNKVCHCFHCFSIYLPHGLQNHYRW